jgi:chemotaxis protein CheD
MLYETRLRGTRISDYQLKLFGGGDMFPDSYKNLPSHIGIKNADAARDIVRRHGLRCAGEHLEGIGHRNVMFDVRDGQVLVKQVQPTRMRHDAGRGARSCAA